MALVLRSFLFEVRTYQDASAVLADDDFLILGDIELPLGRNLVVTSAAGVSLDRNNRQTVMGIGPYLLVCGQSPGINRTLELGDLPGQGLLFLGGLLCNGLALFLLLLQITLFLGYGILRSGDSGLKLGYTGILLIDALIGQLQFQLLVLHLAGDGDILAVVLDIGLLLLILGYGGLLFSASIFF